jgi:hypothetical protein
MKVLMEISPAIDLEITNPLSAETTWLCAQADLQDSYTPRKLVARTCSTLHVAHLSLHPKHNITLCFKPF